MVSPVQSGPKNSTNTCGSVLLVVLVEIICPQDFAWYLWKTEKNIKKKQKKTQKLLRLVKLAFKGSPSQSDPQKYNTPVTCTIKAKGLCNTS